MGQQTSVAYNFCCTACSSCPCCRKHQYTELDKVDSLMNDPNSQYNNQSSYQSNPYNQSTVTQTADEQKSSHKSHNNSHHRDMRTKFCAFIIGYHKELGYLLLRAYKKKKGIHFQLPGGHIDQTELQSFGMEEAAKIAAKRELFEETGLNLVNNDRLKFLKLGIKNRLYFQLEIKDNDSLINDKDLSMNNSIKSLDDNQNFYLKISHEHNGFLFVKDVDKAIKMIIKHSGGKNSDALTKYSHLAKHERHRKSSTSSVSGSISVSRSVSISSTKNKKKKKKKKDKKKKKKKKNKNKNVVTDNPDPDQDQQIKSQ